MRPSNRENVGRPQQQEQQQQTSTYSHNNQYYEIDPNPIINLANADSNGLSATPAHLHPIKLCTSSTIISQQQLQEILPGSVFADPSLAHLHYHIVPSRRVIGNYSEPNNQQQQSCRTLSRIGDHPVVHQQHYDSHYQRHSQLMRPPLPIMRSANSIDNLDKEQQQRNDRPISSSFDHLNGYSQFERNDKMKNISLVELSNDTQVKIYLSFVLQLAQSSKQFFLT